MMLILRCTKKLRTRLHAGSIEPGVESTTILGDWYATIYLTRPTQLILLVNERSRLSIVLPAREYSTLLRRIPGAAAVILLDLGVEASIVDRECTAMRSVQVAPTRSRSVLGTMNDFIFQIESRRDVGGELDLRELSRALGRTPVGPLRYERPADVAPRLLAGTVPEPSLGPDR